MATAPAPMGSISGVALPQGQDQQQGSVQAPAPPKADRLNPAVVQQLNLESVKTRALGLFKAISRILEEFDAIARANAVPKWQDVLGQFSMVNLELFNIVEDIKKVSKAFVVHPKIVNAENATILPVMLSSKLLPEIEAEDNAKREQLLHGMQSLPIPMQIEKLKNRIDMIGAACESAEKVIADSRKAYGLGSRQGQTVLPILDKAQAAKIQEQENSLRAAVNYGEGLRMHGDQRHISSSLPMHLVEVLGHGEGLQNVGDMSGLQPKNTPPSFSSGNISNQGTMMQGPGAQLIGRSAPSPSGVSGIASFDNASTPPLPYANSPRSGTNLMNTPSPQHQQMQQQQQQQRQKMMQMSPHPQQLLAQQQQQQLRQSSTPGMLGQNTMQQLHDLQGQAQQKFQQVSGQHQLQYSQPLAQQQFLNRQLQSSHMQHNIGQNQNNQGNQLRTHISQFTGNTGNTLFNAAQSSQNSQMMSNISATIPSPSVLPRVQYGLSGGHPQRGYPSQILNDQMFNMGGSNPASMVGMQQQQLVGQGASGNVQTNTQNLQTGMAGLQSTAQNPNFTQQRQQNQQ